MINRIVRMSFDPQKVDDFLQLFSEVKNKIANVEGCEGLSLMRDLNQSNVLFTYSYWLKKENLEAYRNSDLFKTTWAATKILFNDAPKAWSLLLEEQVK